MTNIFMTNIFEQAARKKLRFDTTAGRLSVEDLWDLPLQVNSFIRNAPPSLNNIAVELHRTIQDSTISFIEPETAVNADLQLRFEIVKHVIEVRKAENKERLEAAGKASRRQKLLGVLAQKEDAELQGLSKEEIRQMINEL